MQQKTVEAYLASFEPSVRAQLESLRAMIREAAPDCAEKLAWGAPTYYLAGRYFTQFAAAEHHIGFYTSPATVDAFRDRFAPGAANNKNTVRFRRGETLPRALIGEMLRFRRRELTETKEPNHD